MKPYRTSFSSRIAIKALQALSGQAQVEDDTFAPTVARPLPAARLASDRGGTRTAAWVETSDKSKHEACVMRKVSDSWYDHAATVAWI